MNKQLVRHQKKFPANSHQGAMSKRIKFYILVGIEFVTFFMGTNGISRDPGKAISRAPLK
jgi:hypothetical protein